MGSVIALSDSTGKVFEAYKYTVYGQSDKISNIGNPYMFTGREYDAETGLYYYRARMYNPGIGRFMQIDPIGYSAGINWYLYCGNNPVVLVDPWGLCEVVKDLGKEWAEQAALIVDQARVKTTIWQALTGRAGYNVDQERRYINTERLKTIDLQHVVSAAMGPPGASTIGGTMVEIKQMWTDPESAFKTEDIISNVLGGVASKLADQRNTSVGIQVGIILKNAKPKGPPYERDY